MLLCAGVECKAEITEYTGHGHELVANMSLQDLESIDGILAVSICLGGSYFRFDLGP